MKSKSERSRWWFVLHCGAIVGVIVGGAILGARADSGATAVVVGMMAAVVVLAIGHDAVTGERSVRPEGRLQPRVPQPGTRVVVLVTGVAALAVVTGQGRGLVIAAVVALVVTLLLALASAVGKRLFRWIALVTVVGSTIGLGVLGDTLERADAAAEAVAEGQQLDADRQSLLLQADATLRSSIPPGTCATDPVLTVLAPQAVATCAGSLDDPIAAAHLGALAEVGRKISELDTAGNEAALRRAARRLHRIEVAYACRLLGDGQADETDGTDERSGCLATLRPMRGTLGAEARALLAEARSIAARRDIDIDLPSRAEDLRRADALIASDPRRAAEDLRQLAAELARVAPQPGLDEIDDALAAAMSDGPLARRLSHAATRVELREVAVALAVAADDAAQGALDQLRGSPAADDEDDPDEDAEPASEADPVQLSLATSARSRTADDLARAREDLAEAQGRLDGLPRPPVGVGLHEIVGRGIDEVVRASTFGLVDDERHPVLGAVGYAILGVLLVLGYRMLELRNNRQYATPIAIAEIAGLGDDVERKVVQQRVRERVFATGIATPGPVPGSTTMSSLQALLSEAQDLPHNKLVAQAASFVQSLGFPPAGVQAAIAITPLGPAPTPRPAPAAEDDDRPWPCRKLRPPPSPPDEGATTATDAAPPTTDDTPPRRYEASIEIARLSGGEVLASTVVVAEGLTGIADRAAHFIATASLDHSRRAPTWAHWQDGDGGALTVYQAALSGAAPTEGGSTAEELPDARRDNLARALRLSPDNALVRMALANQHDLDAARRGTGDAATLSRLRALRLHLETAQDHPSLVRNRYRLATSLLMTTRDRSLPSGARRQHRQAGDQGPPSTELAQEDRIVRHLLTERYTSARAGALAEAPLTSRPHLAALLAIIELEALERLLRTARGLLWRSAAREQRDVAFSLIRQSSNRERHLDGCRTALLHAHVRLARLDGCGGPRSTGGRRSRRRHDQAVTLLACEPGTISVASPVGHYNAACIHAEIAEHHARAGATCSCEGREHATAALRHLESALRRGGPQVFSHAWLHADPDLAPLRTPAHRVRWRTLVETFAPLPETDGADAPR